MKSRLDALLRQRELLREHAQWLDDEIAAERARHGVTSVASVAAPLSHASTPPHQAPATVDSEIAPPEPDIKGLHNEVRSGCMLYFLFAAAVLGGVIAFIYWKYSEPTVPALEPAAQPAPLPASTAAGGAGLH